MKAPAYFVIREFKKYDWYVDVNPQMPKGDDEYDVIIVGSGIGGLTCGVQFSKKRLQSSSFRTAHQVGGYCSSFKKKDFVF